MKTYSAPQQASTNRALRSLGAVRDELIGNQIERSFPAAKPKPRLEPPTT